MRSFQPGHRVFQAQYGVGDILVVDERHRTIEFDDGAVRTFVTRLLQLQPSSEPRPVTPPPPARRPCKRRTCVEVSGDTAHTT